MSRAAQVSPGVLAILLLFALLPLAGCGSVLTESTSDAAGIAGAGIAGAVTKNAAIGTGIGLGVAAAANAGLLYAERGVHHHQQDSIAAAAGPLDNGATASWKVSHLIPIERDMHGQVVVTRIIGGTDFTCKEIIFSVDGDAKKPRNFFTAFICRDGDKWRWATAEPATERWGSLQ